MMTLGLSEDATSSDSSLAELGGDSLAAIQFARAVSDAAGVALPVSFVLDRSHSLSAIIAKACQTPCKPCVLLGLPALRVTELHRWLLLFRHAAS